MLTEIVRLLPPDAVPNDYGDDPWLIAVRASQKIGPKTPYLFLCAYLLSRALGSRSRSCGELAQVGFEPVYTAAAADRLPEEAWHILEPRLPWSFSWVAWDRCQRIRTAVSDLFVERDLAPELFARITTDDHMFASVAETSARTWRGRRFLEQVRRHLNKDRGRNDAARMRAIDALINHK
jgi:hypothetical protein